MFGLLVQLLACACDILIHSLGVTWRWDIFTGCDRFMSIFFHDEFFHNESDESHTHTQKGSDETYMHHFECHQERDQQDVDRH